MADVVQLPGCAREPVQKPPRQHGPYASKSVIPHAKMIGLRQKRKWDARLARAHEDQPEVLDQEKAVAVPDHDTAELLSALALLAAHGRVSGVAGVFQVDGESRAIMCGGFRKNRGAARKDLLRAALLLQQPDAP